MPTFLRRNAKRHSNLGKRRKKKQNWRYPTGRHNKMREKRRGYPITVSVGYQKDKKIKLKNKLDILTIAILVFIIVFILVI